MRSYTLEEARAIALRAAGFGNLDAAANPPAATLRRLGLLQIDTVNVFARAHTMPAFSRYGLHPQNQLAELMSADQPQAIEYWAHEASIIEPETYKLFGWRRNEYVSAGDADSSFWAQNQKLAVWIMREISERGPLTVAELEHEANKPRGGWWGWSDIKRLAVIGFLRGDLVAWGRRGSTRVFDLASNHPDLFKTDLTDTEQQTELLRRAALVLGIAHEQDLADYYRMTRTQARPLLRGLVERGELKLASVGDEQVYLPNEQVDVSSKPGAVETLQGAAEGRQAERPVLLSPFDPLVWFRPRAEWLWDFRYRIEIYTPAPKREFGYYTLPILFENLLVGRIDLKAERKSKTLLVRAAWGETSTFGKAPSKSKLNELAAKLWITLWEAAEWQGCTEIFVEERGNLAELLKKNRQFHGGARPA